MASGDARRLLSPRAGLSRSGGRHHIVLVGAFDRNQHMGFTKDEMCSHGFRSAASSMLNESGLWNADAIERQLAHVDNDSVRRAYARADF